MKDFKVTLDKLISEEQRKLNEIMQASILTPDLKNAFGDKQTSTVELTIISTNLISNLYCLKEIAQEDTISSAISKACDILSETFKYYWIDNNGNRKDNFTIPMLNEVQKVFEAARIDTANKTRNMLINLNSPQIKMFT